MTRKKQGSQIFCTVVEQPKTDNVLALTPGRTNETTWVWKFVSCKRPRGKEDSWQVGSRTRLCKEQVEPRCTVMRTPHTRKHLVEVVEETWKIIQGLYILSLSPYGVLIIFLQLSHSISSLFVLVNKDRSLVVRHLFPRKGYNHRFGL